MKEVREEGGGYAGTSIAYVEKKRTEEYIEYMDSVFGKENVFEVGGRNDGACKENI